MHAVNSATTEREWITNEFLRKYLQYTEQTESPKIFHIWSALAGISACFGRHVWIETGIGPIYGNMYILLVGPPGVRKSGAAKFAMNLVQARSNVKFAPDDTSGQRQGLIAAMVGDDEVLDEEQAILDIADEITKLTMLGQLPVSANAADRHVMHIFADEWGSFIGANNLDLTRFLLKMWDGTDYSYKLKTSSCTLKSPLLSMLGCTTPGEIATLLPPEAMGSGFMSRIVLVHASQKYKKLHMSETRLDESVKDELIDTYAWVANKMQGAMTITEPAQKYLKSIYMQDVRIPDTRFMYYTERRYTHLLKLCMTLAGGCKRYTIELDDVIQADTILSRTEEVMPDALGEYGLSPIAVSKQKLVEYIQHAKGPVHERVLWVVMQRDMKLVDFKNALSDMINAGKIVQVDTKHGKAFVYNDAIQQAIGGLAEDDDDEDNWP